MGVGAAASTATQRVNPDADAQVRAKKPDPPKVDPAVAKAKAQTTAPSNDALDKGTPPHPETAAPRTTAVTTIAPTTTVQSTATAANLTPAETAQARTLATGVLDKTQELAGAGLNVDPDHAADEAPATTSRKTTVRDIAAALYNANSASEAQIAAVHAANPDIKGDDVDAGVNVAIAGTPASLEMARDHLQLAQLTVSKDDTAAPTRAAIAERLAEVNGGIRGNAIAHNLVAAAQRATQMVQDHRTDGLSVPFASVRRDIDQARASNEMTPDQAKLATANVDAAEARALAAGAQDIAERFTDKRTEFQRSIDHPQGGDEGVALQQTMVSAVADMDKARDATVAKVRAGTDAAIDRLQKVAQARPEDAATINAAITALRASTDRQVAGMYVATGDHAAAERTLLPEALLGDRDLLKPDVRYNVDDTGRGRGLFGAIFSNSTNVGRLTPEHRDETARAIAALPEADRKRAVDGLMQLSDVYSHADDVGRANTSREVLGAVAKFTNDEPLALRTAALHAQHLTRTNNFDGARQELEQAYARATKLAESPDAKTLQLELATGLVAVDRAQASTGNDAPQKAAADHLGALLQRFEKAGPLSRDQLARFAMLHAQTLLAQNRAVDAGNALNGLDRYSDIPWVKTAADAYRADHSERGITAALKVGLRAANSGSTARTLGATFGTGLVFAGVGALVAGPPGAGVGFLVGSAIGNAGVTGYNVAHHWDEVTQAFNTGMTSLTAGDAATDGALLGINLAASAAPIGGYARLATQGISRAAILDTLSTVNRTLGANVAPQILEREATRQLAREFAKGSLAFGGKPLAIGTATSMAASVAADYTRIQQIADPQERERAMEHFRANFGKTLLVSAATIGANAVAAKLALRGGMRWPAPKPEPIVTANREGVPEDFVGPVRPPQTNQPDVATTPQQQTVAPIANAPPAALPATTATANKLNSLAGDNLELLRAKDLESRQRQLVNLRGEIRRAPDSPERTAELARLEELNTQNDGALKTALYREADRIDILDAAQRKGADQLREMHERLDGLGTWTRDADGRYHLATDRPIAELNSELMNPQYETALADSARRQRQFTTLAASQQSSPLGLRSVQVGARVDAFLERIGEQRAAIAEAVAHGQDQGGRVSFPNLKATQDRTVKMQMLTPEQQNTYAVTFDKNGLALQNGQPVSTAGAATAFAGDNHGMFVLTKSGKFLVAVGEQSIGNFHHSTLAGGEEVLAAGEIEIKDGVVTAITDGSGHYVPPPLATRQLALYLQSHNVSLAKVDFTSMVYPMSMPITRLLPANSPEISHWAKRPPTKLIQ